MLGPHSLEGSIAHLVRYPPAINPEHVVRHCPLRYAIEVRPQAPGTRRLHLARFVVLSGF